MFSGILTVVQLCWIFSLLLPFVLCQLGGDGFGIRPLSPPGLGGFVPDRNRLPSGGGFTDRPGQGMPPSQIPEYGAEQQMSPEDESSQGKMPMSPEEAAMTPAEEDMIGNVQPDEAMTPNPAPSAVAAMPAETPTLALMSEGPTMAEPSSLRAAIPSPTEAAMVETSSMVAPLPLPFKPPLSSLRAAVPPPELLSNTVPSAVIPISEGIQQVTSPTLTIMETTTTSMTIFVTASVTPTHASPLPKEQNPSSAISVATESPQSSTDDSSVSKPSSTNNEMSSSAQAGIGVGVSFAVLSLVGMSGFYLYRRKQRRHRFNPHDLEGGFGGGGRSGLGSLQRGFGAFFKLPSRRNSTNSSNKSDNIPKHDAEWSIESASKVEIVKGGSARSIHTSGGNGVNSRSASRGSDATSTTAFANFPSTLTKPSMGAGHGTVGSPGGKTEVLKVGMRLPDRPPNAALTSNPISPPVDITSFPSPPSSRRGRRASVSADRKNAEKERKTGSWPLPD